MASLGHVLNAKNTEAHNNKLSQEKNDNEIFANAIDCVIHNIINDFTNQPRNIIILKLRIPTLDNLQYHIAHSITNVSSIQTIMYRFNEHMFKENVHMTCLEIEYSYKHVIINTNIKSTVKNDVVDGKPIEYYKWPDVSTHTTRFNYSCKCVIS